MTSETDAERNGDQRIFYGALVLGLVLVLLVMFARDLSALNQFDARVVLYAGVGILLGAFGSTMTVNFKGITIVGVAAITFGLLWVAHNWTAVSYVEGVIHGDVGKVANIYVIGDQQFLGATEVQGTVVRYRFVVPESEYQNMRKMQVALALNEPAEEEEPPSVYISTDQVTRRGSKIELRFDLARQEILDHISDEVLAIIPSGPTPAAALLPHSSATRPAGAGGLVNMLLPAAYAQDGVSALIAQLESPNTIVRRQTRTLLAQRGPVAVPALIGAYRQDGASYRTRLGILVALTEMLRIDQTQAPSVSAQLTEGDLKSLVEALAHPDRTMRIYAGEFLYDLGDVRVVEPALGLARDLDFDDKNINAEQGRYLAVFVISGARQRLPAPEQRKLDCRLLTLQRDANTGTDTGRLITKTVGAGVTCP